jgi:hypothetical protein
MLNPLETAAAENILKLIAGATIHEAENVGRLSNAYGTILGASHYNNPGNNCATPCGTPTEDTNPVVDTAASAETPAATRSRKPKADKPAEPAAAAPAADPLADPLAAETPAAAKAPAGKSYAEKQAEIKLIYTDKLRILSTRNEEEGNAFKMKIAAEMEKRGIKKLSDPGEDKADDWFSFIVNVVPMPKPSADIDI